MKEKIVILLIKEIYKKKVMKWSFSDYMLYLSDEEIKRKDSYAVLIHYRIPYLLFNYIKYRIRNFLFLSN